MAYTPVQVFNGINGFALKPTSQFLNNSNIFNNINRRESEGENKEFIEITKEKNKLPRVTLRTYVLYYRNNGDRTDLTHAPWDDHTPDTGLPVKDDENYRFYNNYSRLKKDSTWIISGWGQYVVGNYTYTDYADQTGDGPNGSITGDGGNGLVGTASGTVPPGILGQAAQFEIEKINNGADIKITCIQAGDHFKYNDYITFRVNAHTWLTGTEPQQNINFQLNENADGTPQIEWPSNGRQLGWIWGFPLFDVGRGNNSNNWPRWKSCASASKGGACTDDYPNDPMLVDISDKQNIIVLDMSKYQFMDGNTKKGDGFDNIKRPFTQWYLNMNPSFYMTLRITDSSENAISFGGTKGYVYLNGSTSNTAEEVKIGKNGNWPPFHIDDLGNYSSGDAYGRFSNKWCTLVEYEFYCDLVNPKPFLDFTPNYFSFDFTNGSTSGRRFIKNEAEEDYVSTTFEPGNGKDINNYTDIITLKIKTGLGFTGQSIDDMNETMTPGNIFKGLTMSDDMDGFLSLGANANRLKEKRAWDKTHTTSQWALLVQSWTVAKIIGGWYSRGGSSSFLSEREIGYYGSIVSSAPSSRQTKYNETVSWKNDIELVNYPFEQNVWPATDNGSKKFTLRNVLWCSLRSPRKIKVNYIGDNSTAGPQTVLIGKNRFLTNFIDLSSNNGSNEILGGGYARISNELDLPRKSEKPYFSSTCIDAQGDISQINSNTVGIIEFDIENSIQYLDASRNNNGNTLSLNDIQYYKIQYKLLIPPDNGNSYSIKYSFGKTTGNVTTFFRFEDMSGTPDPFPDGSNNHYAIRDSESIELKWEAGETDIKTIYITDVASGTKNVVSTINSTGFLKDASYNEADAPETYDLSFNVFQLNFFSRNAIDETNTTRDELPYTIYTFDTAGASNKFIDVSYNPVGYVPYRYLNYFKKELHPPFYETQPELLFFDSTYTMWGNGYSCGEVSGPFITREETIAYNPGKIFPRGIPNGVDRTNALVIDPSNTDVFPTVDIDISGDVIFDLSFSVTPNQLTPAEAADPANQGQEIATFDKHISNTNVNIFGNDRPLLQKIGGALDIQGNTESLWFDEPLQLMLKNYLIPDYWRLSNKLNILRTSNDTSSSNDSYRYYNEWTNQIRTSMIFDILSITLKSQGSIDDKRVSNLLVNTNIGARGSSEYSAITVTGQVLNNSTNDLVYEVQGALSVPSTDYLNLEPIIVLLKASFDGPFGTLGQNFIGNKATAEGGINVPYPAQQGIPANDSKFVVNTVLLDTLRRGNNVDGSDLGGSESAYNGIFDINAEVPEKADYGLLKQNNSFIGTIIGPTPLPVLLVDISSAVQINPSQFEMLNDENNKVTIEWSGFSFSKDPDWNLGKSDIYWSVSRYNLSTGVSKTLLQHQQIKFSNNRYTFIDTSVVVFTKYKYTITGIFYWTGITDYVTTTEIPYLNVPGFSTTDLLICKYNRFPFGRYNSTSTNLKLYAPLRLTTAEGQEDQHGNKIGGPCRDPNNPSLNLFTRTSRISSSNNIYANTTNQVSKKQTYVILSKSRFRPFR